MRKLIQSKRRHFHNVKSSMMNYLTSSPQNAPKDMLIDDSAAALVAELGACLEEMEVKGRSFGQFSMTAVFYHDFGHRSSAPLLSASSVQYARRTARG